VVGGDDDDEIPLIAFLWVKKVTKFSQFVQSPILAIIRTRAFSLSLSLPFSTSKEESDDKKSERRRLE